MKNPKMQGRSKQSYDVDQLFRKIRSGDRLALSRAITLIESQSESHGENAAALLEKCIPHSGKAKRIGITGSPGVGKSTFIETLGYQLIEKGHSPAVLAVDPSSTVSQGSLLGDKTRMPKLSKHPKAYVRPSPARETLGGVAHATRESIILCEAAGFDIIMIETVGVGQSETLVKKMVDFFLLLIMPGSGDDLQGIKRGIVELADLICINKADGERKSLAKKTQRDFRNALHLFSEDPSGWKPKVITTSGLETKGLDGTWEIISDFFQLNLEKELLEEKRAAQDQFWLGYQFQRQLEATFKNNPRIKALLAEQEQALKDKKISLTGALLKLKKAIHEIIQF